MGTYRIAAARVRQDWGATLDRVQVEPVVITAHGRDRAVMISPALASEVLGEDYLGGAVEAETDTPRPRE